MTLLERIESLEKCIEEIKEILKTHGIDINDLAWILSSYVQKLWEIGDKVDGCSTD